MSDLANKPEWADFILSFFDGLNLYLVEKIRDYNIENEESIEGLVNASGEWVYKCNANENIGLTHHCYCSKIDKELNRKLTFFYIYRSEENEVDRKSIFIYKYEDNQLMEIFKELNILKLQTISSDKIVIGVQNALAIDKIDIKIANTSTNEITDIITTLKIEDEFFLNQIRTHSVYGSNFLFSVAIEKKNYETNESESFIMFDNNGKQLFDFNTTIGDRGENTWFEPNKTSFGITYKKLDKPITYENIAVSSIEDIKISECLIDASGNFYGEFLTIQGANPSIGVKSYTKYPNFIDGVLLCNSLPINGKSYLVIIDRQGNKIETSYQCPWLNTTLFKSVCLINDKNIFGKKCIVVVCDDNLVRLMSFDGKLIQNLLPTTYDGLWRQYSKCFTDQKK